MGFLKPTYCIFFALAFHGFDTPKAEKTPEYFDENCYKRFGGVNFMAWVVRIILNDRTAFMKGPNKNYPHLLATGNIITEHWVLTACSPLYRVVERQAFDKIRVLPAVTPYSNAVPDLLYGKFPYADANTDGCIVGRYRVKRLRYHKTTGGDCTRSADSYPNVTNNFLLLEMETPIEVGPFTIFPKLPFSYEVDLMISKIDWFNTYRKARCVIAKLNTTVKLVDPKRNKYSLSNHFDNEGFTYKTIPFITECVPNICRHRCADIEAKVACKKEIEEKGLCMQLKGCMSTCFKEMTPLLGTLLCLVRMHEVASGAPQPYSVAYDRWGEQVPYTEGNNDCVPRSDALPVVVLGSIKPIPIMGAPVVCNGEAIAIVTRCDQGFIVATTLVPVRHRLLKVFDTSYQKDLTFLANT